VEASAFQQPQGLARLPRTIGLLRLRSDEQLLALFRAGNDDAFGVLHDRYSQRLFAYVRQMLASLSRQDAEDVLQDVFVRAYGALRADTREMNVRAWLYRVAHNRCIDHLRRPVPPAAEIYEVSRRPLHDPTEEAQRREDLSRLVEDIARLPEQQRSALLMRELDGLSYADLATALDVTVPAIKSLLVRARMGLVDAAEAREADCGQIRDDLLDAYDRGVKAPGRARRHLRTCDGCTEYRSALRGMQRSFAALSPVTLGPLALSAQLLGIGGGGAAAGGGGAVVATATAGKVAAVVCTAAITAGGAVEAKHIVERQVHQAPAALVAPAPVRSAPAAAAAMAEPLSRPGRPAGTLQAVLERPVAADVPAPAPDEGAAPAPAESGAPAPGAGVTDAASGGTLAPDSFADDDTTVTPSDAAPDDVTAGGETGTPTADAGHGAGVAENPSGPGEGSGAEAEAAAGGPEPIAPPAG
jgi:RNA polymerase sigma factor (sigma-70 family)